MKPRFTPMLAFSLAAMLTAPLTHAEGGISGGGGNAVGDTLFDLYENKGSERIDPLSHPALLEVYGTRLNEIERDIPGFMRSLRYGAEQVTFYLEPKPFQKKDCENSSMILVNKEVVACQVETEVRIKKSWFDRVSIKNRAALIMHELLIAALKSEENQKDRKSKEKFELAIRDLNRLLLKDSNIQPNEMVSFLSKRFNATYLTREKIQHIEALTAKANALSDQVDYLFKNMPYSSPLKCEVRNSFFDRGTEEWVLDNARILREVGTETQLMHLLNQQKMGREQLAEIALLKNEVSNVCGAIDKESRGFDLLDKKVRICSSPYMMEKLESVLSRYSSAFNPEVCDPAVKQTQEGLELKRKSSGEHSEQTEDRLHSGK